MNGSRTRNPPTFYLGAHDPAWLARLDVPMFVSHARLRQRTQHYPQALGPWALDSGAFGDIVTRGRFTATPAEYVAVVRRYRDEVGRLVWAAPQDHMCEPWVLARSEVASTVVEAQAWTVRNYLDLRTLDAALPFVPVLQGQTLADYRRHADAYLAAGVDLTRCDLVGIGSVCRRQATREIGELVAALALDGLRLHGFGVKAAGIARYGGALTSADSMAWSYGGRRVRPCPHGRATCGDCIDYALAWRADVLASWRPAPVQLTLW